MPLPILMFEDDQARHLAPLTLTRPVFDLRLGLTTIGEKWAWALGAGEVCGPLRPHLEGVFPGVPEERRGASALWINARYLPTPSLVEALRHRGGERLGDGDILVAATSSAAETAAWLAAGRPAVAPTTPCGVEDFAAIAYPWDLVRLNPQAIALDAEACGWKPGPAAGVHASVVIDRPDRVFMHPAAVVEPGAILIAAEGPILLDADARVMAGAVVRGPVAVGRGAMVRMGARIYGGTTIGPFCKVGGEVATTIFHSYSNKAHDGYVGDSVLGQWINLGAGTTASNLKMTYGTVKVVDWPSGVEIDTGEQFLGTVMGDHGKTGINTALNTGTVCGVASIVVGSGFPARWIPSFKWSQSGTLIDYRPEKAVVDMERMMARRGIALDAPYRRMMEAVFAMGRG